MRKLRPVLILLVVLASTSGPAGGETPYSQLYFRDIRSKETAIEVVRGRALVRNADTVLFLFDRATFDPPPGQNEFNHPYDYRPDLEGWRKAILKKATHFKGRAVYACFTTASKPERLGTAGFERAFILPAAGALWNSPQWKGFTPALDNLRRILAHLPGERRMVVLISADMPPEDLSQPGSSLRDEQRWRRKLLSFGEYWDEEAIGRTLLRSKVVLDVIAPEAMFGDFLPVTGIPEAPWASRPSLFEAAFQMRFAAVLTPGKGKSPTEMPPLRFDSMTPRWFMHVGSYVPRNTDCPSAFGYWPFLRAAARSNGSYIFYPFPPAHFLDRLPYLPRLLRDLAPETTSRAEYVRSRSGDRALDAMIRASRLVRKVTPWEDGLRYASGWLGFRAASPATLTARYRERNKPWDQLVWGQARTAKYWVEKGEEIAKLLPVYEKACGILDERERAIRAGKEKRPSRRSMADLRLARFWFEMSTFHLHALSIYLTELERHLIEKDRLARGELLICYVPAIRLSDCLMGYEGKVLPPEEERRLQALRDRTPPRHPDLQDNILPHMIDSPWYRSLRNPGAVMKNLDRRLVPRALRMIDAGRAVMEHEGKSPWGWMVYYSEAVTFIWKEGPPAPPGLRPGKPEDPGATTPHPTPKSGGPGTGK